MGQVRNIVACALAGLVSASFVAFEVSADIGSVRPVPRPGTEVVASVAPDTVVEVTRVSEVDPVSASPVPRPRPDDLLQGFGFRFALTAGRNGDWGTAKRLAAQDGPIAEDIIEWQWLRARNGSFQDYRAFLAKNGDWPGLKLLRKRGEAAITAATPAAQVIAYFEPEPPQTGTGALRLVAAYSALGQNDRARAELTRAWTTMDMTAAEEAAFLDAHGRTLAPLHATRLDDALWRGDLKGARRMLAFVDDNKKTLANARIALQARTGNADALWKAVPDALARDSGLAKDRMRWLIAVKRRADAGDLIIAQSTSAERLGRPDEWAHWRRILARQAMRDGQPRRAYTLSSAHFIDGGSDYADLEWLSGYLALRYQGNATQALTHFRRFRSEIFTPISLGRAGYWEGRALEEMGKTDAAAAAYRDAAKHQTSYYGLLAAERAGIPMDPALTGAGPVQPWETTRFAQTSVFKAAQVWAKAGRQHQYEVSRFLRHLAETTAEDELVALGDYTLELANPFVSVRVAKQIAQEGAVAHRAYYPLTDLGPDELPVEAALALAIARRESEFYPLAVSGAGARGLMQLMPGTARDMAGKLGLPYSKGRLTSDPVYNAILGSAYLDHLMDEFGKNITLISVGYNAGPHRARTWSQRFGDPRGGQVDIVDWVEHIPFNETRNYVMRVAESLQVYRARLTGQVQPIRLTAELTGR